MSEQSIRTPPRRTYRMDSRRAASEATRRRITAAAFDLHATIGPSRTTIQAIAARAGVQRHTVYAHFPDMDSLYRACTEHGIESTGMPSPDAWSAIPEPVERLRAGLTDLFAWYRANERMLRTILHDVDPTEPVLEPDQFDRRMALLFEALAAGWVARDDADRSVGEAVLALAMSFETWATLTATEMTDDHAVDLLVSFVRSVHVDH